MVHSFSIIFKLKIVNFISNMSKNLFVSSALLYALLFGCDSESVNRNTTERAFKMGFTTWSFGPNLNDVNETYAFIENNADIYTEHIDINIPWNAWINDIDLPLDFTNEINGRVNRIIEAHQLLLSVGLLNLNRDELAQDFDGSIPFYANLNDVNIENAYFKHINYLVSRFNPDYLVISIEANELRLRAEEKWNAYKLLMQNVRSRVAQAYPDLKISESISLHNLYQSDIPNPEAYTQDVFDYVNQMDFIAISYYPFLKNQNSISQFQETLDFLHSNTNKPIAFSETGHIAENLIVPNLNISIIGNETEQDLFLNTLLTNAEVQDYEFIIWWAHRDYDALWETFPEELLDIGQLWRDTGLRNEASNNRLSKATWDSYLQD